MKTALPLLLAGALCAGCERPPAPVHEDVRPVRTLVAGATDGSVGAAYAGTIVARHESRLGFQVGGRIVARLVDVGSPVRRGQPLLRLDPAQEQLHVIAAEADVEAAKSRVAQARVDLERAEALLARRFASPAEVDRERLALSQAEAQLKSAIAQQQVRVNQRGYTTLVADRDGVVAALSAETGQVVAAGQAIVTVAADGDREVQISIAESRVDELRQAKKLQVAVWAQPGRQFTGVLRELAPDTDSVTRTYAARIAIRDADASLRLGMTATVLAPDVAGASAIRLPLTAILDRTGRPQVWIVDAANAQVMPREVTLGAAQQDHVLVTSGLKGGETVVTAGVTQLHAGQKVRIAAAPAPLAQGAVR